MRKMIRSINSMHSVTQIERTAIETMSFAEGEATKTPWVLADQITIAREATHPRKPGEAGAG
jgi:hypothetical protein